MRRLSILEKFGYGLGDTASNIVFQVVVNYLLFFYTDVFGIEAAAAGTLMLVVRIFDAFTDPVMGGLADRTRTRWGTYRPWLLFMAVPYGIVAVLAFVTPDLSEGAKLAYAYITYIILMTVYTAINIPYSALGGVITADPQERASVQSWRFMLAMTGGLIIASATLPLVGALGQGDQQKGFTLAMVVLGAVAVVCFFACFALTKERENPAAAAQRRGYFSDFFSVFRNDQFVVVAVITFILLVSVAMKGSSRPYYVLYYLGGDQSDVSLFFTLDMLAGVFGAMFANWLSKRYDKVRVMTWASGALAVVYAALALVPPEQFTTALVLATLSNFVHMIIIPYLFSMVADTVDYGLDRWGRGAMAMSYSAHLLALKFGIALGGALAGWSLGWVGYQPNAEQTPEALNGIVFLFGWASAIAGVLLVFCLRFYRLDRAWAEARSA